MSYLMPSEFVTKLVDQGEAKVYMGTRDTLIRAFMAGATLALAVIFAITIATQTGQFLIGALLFPVGFVMLYLMGYDLLTGVFMLVPIAWLDKRPGVTLPRMLKCWALVGLGNLGGALFIATFGYLNFTMGGTEEINAVGQTMMAVGESRTVGYQEAGLAGWIVLFLRGMFCNWMVSMGVVGAAISTTVSGKIMAMWMPIIVFFYLGFEHSVVNMFLFPIGLMMGADFTLYQYIMWNEIPTVLGNLVGGLTLGASRPSRLRRDLMDKLEMRHTLLAAKARKKLSWDDIGKAVGMSPVWVASACYGMNSASSEIAHQLCDTLGVESDVADALVAFPTKAWDEAIPQDPFIYRLYEVVGVYGETLKDVVQEKFGDGIMSAIDFTMEVDKIEDPKGDRVLLTLNGKFLPYKSW
mgnify:CR=1 FL=1